jgi:hypothetical protein
MPSAQQLDPTTGLSQNGILRLVGGAMETTEKIVEAYIRYVKRWATIPNVRCDGQFEIDLLAIDPRTCARYHIETSISVSPAFSKLTGIKFDPALHKAKMRRTLGYFIKRKFKTDSVVRKLEEYGFKPDAHKRIIVTWGWTKDAAAAAREANIELLDFRDIMQQIAQSIEKTRSYFTDDTLRTIGLYAQALYGSQLERQLRDPVE